MASKQDAMNVLNIRLARKCEAIDASINAWNKKHLDKQERVTKAFAKKHGFKLANGYLRYTHAGIEMSVYAATRNYVDKKVEETQNIINKDMKYTPIELRSPWKEKRVIERQARDIKEKLLLHGMNPEILKMIEGF